MVGNGTAQAGLVVQLADAQFHSISGKQVQITMNAGARAIVTPVNATTNVSNGAALFTVTDSQLETVTFTATVDGVQLTQHPTVTFVSAPAASGGIAANPTTVNANGSAMTTIT